MSLHSILIQKLLKSNAHIGRRVTGNHFKIFSEGIRNNVNIVDSDKTLICLRSACNFIGHLTRNNGRVLFVNTNPLFDEIIAQTTQAIGIKNDKTWRLGGYLTNSSSPRIFRGRNKKFNLCSVNPPDCIVIVDTEGKSSVIREAYRLKIPVVGLVDSSMPWDTYKRITYPVPANDSMEFVYLFCNLITKTILKEKKEAVVEKDEDTLTGENVEQDNHIGQTAQVFPYESLQPVPEGLSEKVLLEKLVIVKFNGSLGTRIGFSGPKCTMEIGGGLTCLDLIINQIEDLNAKYGCNIPLLLLNAGSSHRGVLKFLEKHPNKNIHCVPQSSLHLDSFSNSSAKGQDNEDEMSITIDLLLSQISDQYINLHVEIYKLVARHVDNLPENSFNLAEVVLPLVNSGKLGELSSQGKEFILMLGSDNLAQVVDLKILYHMMENDIGFCLEVMPKSSELEESKQSQNEEDTPIPTTKKNWKFVDTVWMGIQSIENILEVRAAEENLTISKLFDNHFSLSVPKSRYLPVEATSDLFLLQSDLYTLSEGTVTRNTARENPTDPSIELGPLFKTVNDFQERFKSIPSIIGLDSLKVAGDVSFGTGISLKGKVNIHARPGTRIEIPDGAVLEDTNITGQEDLE